MQEADILVVLPTLGTRHNLLRNALTTVEEQRREVALRLALVCPKDASEARDLAVEFGAEIVDDPGRGMSAAMNAGRAIAGAEKYTIWLGDDDGYMPGGLRILKSLLDANPRALVAYGGCHYVDQSGKVLWTSSAGRWARKLIGFGPNLIPHPAALVRIDALDSIGGYREDLSLAMDLDVFLQLKKQGPFVFTKEPVAFFGWQPDSLTVSSRRNSEKEARAVKHAHLSMWLRLLSWTWEWPVAFASRVAARRLDWSQTAPRTR